MRIPPLTLAGAASPVGPASAYTLCNIFKILLKRCNFTYNDVLVSSHFGNSVLHKFVFFSNHPINDSHQQQILQPHYLSPPVFSASANNLGVSSTSPAVIQLPYVTS